MAVAIFTAHLKVASVNRIPDYSSIVITQENQKLINGY